VAGSLRLRGVVLATVVAVPVLALACWLGTRSRPQAPHVPPAPESETVANAAEASSPLSEALPTAVVLGPAAPAPTEDEADDAVPPAAEPSSAPAPAPDRAAKPEGPPPPSAPKPSTPEPAPFRRRSNLTEDDLRKQLAAAPEVGLTPGVRQALVQSYATDFRSSKATGTSFTFDPYILLRNFPQARELPVRTAPTCQLGPRAAFTLGVLARKLHAYLDLIAPLDGDGKRTNPNRVREVLRQERRGQRPEWLRAEALPAMLQILMAEDVPLRLLLVDLLAEVEAKPATVALAQRAVFDLSPDVRQAAVHALRDRPRADSRPVLVGALRYPWPPAADHAAEALAALDDRDAVPLLVAQLGKPDPEAPYSDGKGGWGIRHVVRVNHLANCLLCHVPAVSGNEPVVGPDPSLSLPSRRGAWGGGGKRSSGRGASSGDSQPLWVRADVQFFRQDFSVSFPVGLPGVAVQGLRFDYLVSTRRPKAAELRASKQQPVAEPTAYPQRDAALFALRALTAKDPGPTTEAWVQLFPHASAEAEGVRLSASLLRAAPEDRDLLLVRYRDAKDDGTTAGLACAISHLPGKLQGKVREVLVVRLSRLSVDALRERLQDDDGELRRAAALACVRKADEELIPDLIGLLVDPEPDVAEGAQKVLRRLAGEDFGPPAGAGPEERVEAAVKWQAWWRGRAGL
jgi:HEAT repeat protein